MLIVNGFRVHAMQDMESGECLAFYQGEEIAWAASMSELIVNLRSIFQ
jgi:hypothetical protein